MSEQTLGQIIDNFGIDLDADGSELIESAIVVLKIVDLEGTVTLKVRWHDGLDTFTRVGMLRGALLDAEWDFRRDPEEE